MWLATNGMDVGSTTMMIFGFREREVLLRFFEKTTGLRMNHNFIRPGGTAADLPDGWEDDVEVILDNVERRLDDYDALLTGQPIFRERMEGVGALTAEEALALGVTGPILRSTGFAWDLRGHALPGLRRGRLRRHRRHVRGQLRPLRHPPQRDPRVGAHLWQVLKMPPGDYRVQDKKVTPPPRARIDESMEALIHHFKIFTEGFKVPEGEVYVAIESPRGELGCYLVSDGSSKPFRMHIRGRRPS